jgi:hypothetical protein
MFPRGVGVERWVTYFFPENQALMVFNSIWVPSVSPFTLNPCSKSTIQMKVAVRKARVQRTLETMRMPEKRADFMGKRAEMSSTHFKQAKCVPEARFRQQLPCLSQRCHAASAKGYQIAMKDDGNGG